MSKKLTRKAFDKWLSEQPEARKFVGYNNDSCPLAVFMQRNLASCRGLPIWAYEFMGAVDKRGFNVPITAARALRILRSIPCPRPKLWRGLQHERPRTQRRHVGRLAEGVDPARAERVHQAQLRR